MIAGMGGYLAIWKTDERALRVMAKMEATYATCKSFRDRIEVTTVSHDRGERVAVKKWVANVVFARPASLHFEFSERLHGKLRPVCLLCAQSKRSIRRFGGLDNPVERRMTWTGEAYVEFKGKPVITPNEDLAELVYSLMAPSRVQ